MASRTKILYGIDIGEQFPGLVPDAGKTVPGGNLFPVPVKDIAVKADALPACLTISHRALLHAQLAAEHLIAGFSLYRTSIESRQSLHGCIHEQHLQSGGDNSHTYGQGIEQGGQVGW
jgi:hypothetical protein